MSIVFYYLIHIIYINLTLYNVSPAPSYLLARYTINLSLMQRAKNNVDMKKVGWRVGGFYTL